MSGRSDLSEFELRVLLAVQATQGDVWKVRDELADGGVAPRDRDQTNKALTKLSNDNLVERADDGYRLTRTGRSAAHEAVERLRQLLRYASKTLE
jgi:predicted transcriptional regulator